MTQQQLEQSQDQDSGRGLEFVYFQLDGGLQFASLTALHQSGALLADSSKTSAVGPLFGVAIGMRLLYFTVGPGFRFTHTFLMDLSVDVRDGYSAGSATLVAGTADFLYVPNQNGTKFIVKFVERQGRGSAWGHLKVYAARYNPPSWPTENL